jgi:hypothetical protein
MRRGFDEPAACYPSAPRGLCEHCARRHSGGQLHEPARRMAVVIDASITLRRLGDGCGMFALFPVRRQ